MNLKLGRGDFLVAMTIVLFGAWLAFVASGYPYGSLLRPGSGFAPFWIGLLIVALGMLLLMPGRPASAPAPFRWHPLVGISLGVLSFGLLLETAGFAPATVALVLLSGFADKRNSLMPLVGTAAFMSLAGWLLFIKVLGVPVPLLISW